MSTDTTAMGSITDSIKAINEQSELEVKVKTKAAPVTESMDDEDMDEEDSGRRVDRFSGDDESDAELELAAQALQNGTQTFNEEEEDFDFHAVENILDLPETEFPRFTLAKNKARFLRMVSWYRQKEEWIEVAPLSGVTKLFKQQSKELEGIRASKMDYEMELETGTLTPSQRSYRRDELKMCRVQEKMAVHLIAKLQLKIKSGRR